MVEDVPVNSAFVNFEIGCTGLSNVLYAYVLRGILEEVGCVCVFIDTSVYVCEHSTMI